MSQEMIERYRDMCRRSGVFVEQAAVLAAPSSEYACFRVAAASGNGWMDLFRVNHGITVGRAAYMLGAPFEQTYAEPPGPLRLMVLLSGRARVSIAGKGDADIRGRGVWMRDMRPGCGTITYRQPAGELMEGVSIDVPPTLAEALLEEWRPRRLPSQNGGRACPCMHLTGQHVSAHTARALMATCSATLAGRMQMEALALDLVAGMFGQAAADDGGSIGPALSRRKRAAVDETVDILRREFAETHTIASLARRVGLNECYLKTAFRQVLGDTIGGYLRDLRMRHAREKIESGQYSIQQAALYVGYSNPSHFAAAFRKSFGVAPSRLK